MFDEQQICVKTLCSKERAKDIRKKKEDSSCKGMIVEIAFVAVLSSNFFDLQKRERECVLCL